MTDPDLTPAEARAEVEAFLGPGWIVVAHQLKTRKRILARHGDFSYWAMSQPTYRAAVSALLQAWRDTVRPWCERSALRYHHDRNAIHDAYKLHGETFDARQFVRSRVLKEDSNG